MEITVQRINYDDQSTQGEMLLDGKFFCYTLEPRKDRSLGKPYCVDAGSYPVEVGFSDHFKMEVLKVIGTPGFTAVEVHPGNFPSDTHACCLVGETESKDFVGQSRKAFDMLIELVKAASGPHKITYIG